MKVICVLEIDEDILKNVSADVLDIYTPSGAFEAEMRWVAQSGIILEHYEYITDEDTIGDILKVIHAEM